MGSGRTERLKREQADPVLFIVHFKQENSDIPLKWRNCQYCFMNDVIGSGNFA